MKNKRILVIGSPGAGKSYFSRHIHKITGLPLIHLDDHYWLENWTRPSETQWQDSLTELLNQEEWIIDGNYAKSFEHRLQFCDLVILVNTPTLKCLFRVAMRGLNRLLGKKATMPEQVKNGKFKSQFGISFHFLKLILLYQFQTKRQMVKQIQLANKEFLNVEA